MVKLEARQPGVLVSPSGPDVDEQLPKIAAGLPPGQIAATASRVVRAPTLAGVPAWWLIGVNCLGKTTFAL